jgi:hypothetical protein
MIGGFMEKTRIEELKKYYSATIYLLDQLLASNEHVDIQNIENAKISKQIFEDTITCLNTLLECN